VFVLDHIAKPRIKEHILEPWRTLIEDLAKRENVFCKVSGMITEADWKHWSPGDLEPYVDIVLHAFTPRRVMFGSDWPVMLVAGQYDLWHNTVARTVETLSDTEQQRFWSSNAKQAYRL
jgi:L-fuconolactonase